MNKLLTIDQFINTFSGLETVQYDETYAVAKKLSEAAVPSETKPDIFWEDFYAPLKKGNRILLLPFSMSKDNNQYFIFLGQYGRLDIENGSSFNKDIHTFLKSALEFTISDNFNHEYIEKHVPFMFRTGKILGKYALEKILTSKEKQRILTKYNNYQKKGLISEGCSLNEYLETCEICYRSAFPKEEAGKPPLKMYKSHADLRNGGMLDIKDVNSRQEFKDWYNSDEWSGSHPFEILSGSSSIGISLFPPYLSEKMKYGIKVSTDSFSGYYLKMVEELIKNNIPFTAWRLNDILDYMSGETYFGVNQGSQRYITYFDDKSDKKKYFKHIIWDKLKFLNRGRL